MASEDFESESGCSYVYFFLHASEPLVKIGKADDWVMRAPAVGGADLIDFDQSYVKRVDSTQDAYDLEFMLHKIFSTKRLPLSCGRDGHTEWFCSSVMDEIKAMVRGLQSTSGERVKGGNKPARKWAGEKIDIKKSSDQELVDFILRNCSVRRCGDSILMHPESDGFEFLMSDLVHALYGRLRASGAGCPAFADFPEDSWSIRFSPKYIERAEELFGFSNGSIGPHKISPRQVKEVALSRIGYFTDLCISRAKGDPHILKLVKTFLDAAAGLSQGWYGSRAKEIFSHFDSDVEAGKTLSGLVNEVVMC